MTKSIAYIIEQIMKWEETNIWYSPIDGVSLQTVYDCGCTEEIDWADMPSQHGIELLVNNKGRVSIERDLIDQERYIIKVVVRAEGVCANCKEVDQVKKDFRPDETVQGGTFYHGLAAYSGRQDQKSVVKNALKIKQNSRTANVWEICCSHSPIGPVGIGVIGDVQVASNKDLWSFLTENGQRSWEVNTFRCDYVTTESEVDLTKWDHTEVILKTKEIKFFWVKEWAQQSFSNVVTWAKAHGYDVRVVASRR